MSQRTLNLPAGKILTVSADAFSAGSARRLANAGDATNHPVQAVAAGTSLVLGPFTADRSYAIVTDSGSELSAVITRPDQNATQLVVTEMAADAAIAIAPVLVVFTKSASAIAATLAAPTAEQAGTIMRFIAGTAKAHVITATGLLQDGVTGGGKDLATFGAFVGASLTLVAYNLKWHVLAANVCTIAAA
jgi:hypothetical protein